jgi:hypothetical protein
MFNFRSVFQRLKDFCLKARVCIYDYVYIFPTHTVCLPTNKKQTNNYNTTLSYNHIYNYTPEVRVHDCNRIRIRRGGFNG